MEEFSIGEIARAGMTYERNRMELASIKLAQANVAFSSKAEAMESFKSIQDQFLRATGISSENTLNTDSVVRTIHDPEHPNANEEGNVFFMNVNPTTEMAVLVSAVRAYEANIRAFNTNGEMNQAARSIGDN